MEFVIKIYGAPYGFDLYEGSEQELNYFQVFDNGSTEPVKMTVHRLSNNQISYNYLRYGYITSGGRIGSFFGLSVVFNKSYCSDFMRMFQLFEAVYATILKNGILFEELKSGQWQAKYKVGKFSEAEEEVRRIYGVLGQNIQGALANNVKTMTFPTSVSGDKELRLSTNASNDIVSSAVSKYTVVSISPAYNVGQSGGAEVQTVPLKVLMQLPGEKSKILAEATDWSNRVNVFQTDFRAHKDTNRDISSLAPQYKSIIKGLDGLVQRIDNLLNNVQKWQQIEPSRPIFDEVRQKVTTSRDHINSLLGSLRLYEDTFKTGGDEGGQGEGSGKTGGSSGNGPSPFELFVHKHKKMLIAAGAALLLIVGSVMAYNIIKDKEKTTDSTTEAETPFTTPLSDINVDSLSESALKKYNRNDYVGAYCDYNKAGNTDAAAECQGEQRKRCLAEAKKKNNINAAINFYENEMAKVGYPKEKLNADIENIENKFNEPTTANSSQGYEIRVMQSGNNVTGNTITKKSSIKLECYRNGNQVSDCKWQVVIDGTLYNVKEEFTPQLNNKNIEVQCFVKDNMVANKKLTCKIANGIAGGTM